MQRSAPSPSSLAPWCWLQVPSTDTVRSTPSWTQKKKLITILVHKPDLQVVHIELKMYFLWSHENSVTFVVGLRFVETYIVDVNITAEEPHLLPFFWRRPSCF